jgi:putative DNA primase/helicase
LTTQSLVSIRTATGNTVVVSCHADNLLPVAKVLRQKFPDAEIVICADDDHKTEGNPGIAKALAAAHAVGGLVAVPEFGENRRERDKDFNDLHNRLDLDAVKRCIDATATPDEAIIRLC